MELNDIAVLSLKENDTLFINVDTIDIEALKNLRVSFPINIVPVYCPAGMNVQDQVAVMRQEAASEQSNE